MGISDAIFQNTSHCFNFYVRPSLCFANTSSDLLCGVSENVDRKEKQSPESLDDPSSYSLSQSKAVFTVYLHLGHSLGNSLAVHFLPV